MNTAIDAGADVDVTVKSTGNTALVDAGKEGHFNCVKALAEAEQMCTKKMEMKKPS